MPQETPQHIAQVRQVSVELVLAGGFNPGLYPHRHLAVIIMRGGWDQRVTTAMAAADVLGRFGFELNDMTAFERPCVLCAVFRRK